MEWRNNLIVTLAKKNIVLNSSRKCQSINSGVNNIEVLQQQGKPFKRLLYHECFSSAKEVSCIETDLGDAARRSESSVLDNGKNLPIRNRFTESPIKIRKLDSANTQPSNLESSHDSMEISETRSNVKHCEGNLKKKENLIWYALTYLNFLSRNLCFTKY